MTPEIKVAPVTATPEPEVVIPSSEFICPTPDQLETYVDNSAYFVYRKNAAEGIFNGPEADWFEGQFVIQMLMGIHHCPDC